MSGFDYFVVLAERRTGSNFLEANLNLVAGMTCHGEAFNPNFIGKRGAKDILGVSKRQRDLNPGALLDRFVNTDGLHGFRFFGTHDPRVLDMVLSDPSCAKIFLTRNPLESFVSLEIARATDQWLLRDEARRRTQKITFDAASFDAYLSELKATQHRWFKELQVRGQTAFYLDYDDLHELDVLNGLFEFLGFDVELKVLDSSLKRQNPASLSEKVENFDEMQDLLARKDSFRLGVVPDVGPDVGPIVSHYVASPASPLLYLPVGFGADGAVLTWLAELDGLGPQELVSGFVPAALRQWKHDKAGHRSFTVLRHPVARAHAAFCDLTLTDGPVTDVAAHRFAFLAFLRSGKAIASCPTQIEAVQSFTRSCAPDMLIREADLEDGLAVLAAQVGKDIMPEIGDLVDPHEDLLDRIYDLELEQIVAESYQADYTAFGFKTYL